MNPKQETRRLLNKSLLLLGICAWSSGLSAQSVVLLPDPHAATQAAIDLVRGAKHYISIESYLFTGKTGLMMAQLLEEKARSGVEVHLLVDDFAAGGKRPPDAVLKRLVNAGAKVGLFKRAKINLVDYMDRLHDKVFVVDDLTVKTGGRNVGDEYSGFGETAWRDMETVVQDPNLAKTVQQSYLEAFNSPLVSLPNLAKLSPAELNEMGQQMVQAKALFASAGYNFTNEPDAWANEQRQVKSVSFVHDEAASTEKVAGTTAEVLRLIGSATESIRIETAYFVPTPEMADALKAAKARGVRVIVLTNSKATNNQGLVSAHYEADLQRLSGITNEIWEYSGESTLHAKYMVIDAKTTFIGSYNFNHRSQNHDTEVGVTIESADIAYDVTGHFSEGTAVSELRVKDGEIFRLQSCGFLKRGALSVLRGFL